MKTARAIALSMLLSGCFASHRIGGDPPGGDADVTADAGGPVDAAPFVDSATGEVVPCGPNVCLAGEICCNEECGVCAFPDECMDFGCLDP